ncbi:MAG: tail fiber domain-containing protein [Bacteroidota bacterium]|nr:tail fiber domain-containing protein [Bacteroidota bacterium]
MSSRAALKGFFSTGQRPTGLQFADLIDSAASLAESNPGTIAFTGGIVIGNVGVPATPGAIRWTGVNFEFHNGAGFQPLTFGGTAITNPQDIGNVRIGSTLTGGVAVLAHSTKYSDNDFAFGQTPAGATLISSGTSILLQNRSGGTPTTVLTINGNKATVGTLPGNTTPMLIVHGDAQKTGGGAWSVVSDVRLKKDISNFSEGLDKLLQINPVRFKYKNFGSEPGGNTEQVGVLAHEVQPVFPYMINKVKTKIREEDTEETELLTFNGSALPFVIINAIKELNTRLQQLEQSITKEEH